MRYEIFRGVQALKKDPKRYTGHGFKREWIAAKYKLGMWPDRYVKP